MEEPTPASRHQIDPAFAALPCRQLAAVALDRARSMGVQHADVRIERIRYQHLSVRDGNLEGASEREDLGIAVRVVHRGAWGFAADVVLDPTAAEMLAERAVRIAEVASAMTTRSVELAPEPVHADQTWISAYDVDPFTLPLPTKVALLEDWSRRLLADPRVDHATASVQLVLENKFYADLSGTTTTQQRVRVDPEAEVHGSHRARGVFDAMRTIGPPAGRGWEYLTGTGHDWDAELETLPGLLEDKLAAPSVDPGRYDLVIHPSNLWLTIHESVGHATELDRALGYEANYAGTSFATLDRLGAMRYGSALMNVTGDRTVEHGLATIGYDDEGVSAQRWDIVRDGVLVGYQLDRSMAHLHPELNDGRSNGCAYADSPGHIPIQRMANVSLQSSPDGPSTEELIGQVQRGIHVVGDKSWSIDMQRFNFQFTGQRFFLIEDGRLAGQLRDVAYQATTTDFWGSMSAVGGPQTWELGGAFNCGKAQPGQVASVSHGCPAALFRDVNVLNTAAEAAGQEPDMPPPLPQDLVERALAASTSDDCVVLARSRSSANLRWANNTLTTNGVMQALDVSVVAFRRRSDGTAVGSVSGTAATLDQVLSLVHAADATAEASEPAQDAAELISDVAGTDWHEPSEETSIAVYADLAPGLGEAFARAEAEQRVLYGFVDHEVVTTYLGSTTGLRLRHVQPTGHWGCTGKTSDLAHSAWVGGATRDFRDVDVESFDAELRRRLGWASRSVEVAAGRHDTVLPPTAVADLLIYAYWTAGARAAHDGRSVFSGAGGGTRIGERLSGLPVQLFSDPAHPDLAAIPFVATSSSGETASVFDNGLPLSRADWVREGSLASLLQTRQTAALTGQPVTPAVDNLVLEVTGGQGSTEDLVADVGSGLLLTCLWYIRVVDPQTLLLTGLTRDGVYRIEGGEVVGEVTNFRFNESPVALLDRIAAAGETVPAFSREWGDYFPRTAMPALRVPDFNMSTTSQAH